MNGVEEYNKKYEERIERRIEGNDNLEGFRDYLYSKALSSAHGYIGIARGFLEFTGKSPEKLKLNDFSKYLRIKKDNTSSYQILVYHALKKYSTYLNLNGDIPVDYMSSIERPASKDSMETIEKRAKAFLTKEEMSNYINAIKNEPDKIIRNRNLAIVLVFLTTGIRCSALFKLDVSDIDLNACTIKVTDKGSMARVCYFSNSCKEALVNWLSDRSKCPTHDNALFITPSSGSRISQKTIERVIKKYNYAVPNKKLSPHKLRATYGTNIYNSTNDIYFTQQCMGHSSPITTERYIRGQENQTERAAKLIDDILN